MRRMSIVLVALATVVLSASLNITAQRLSDRPDDEMFLPQVIDLEREGKYLSENLSTSEDFNVNFVGNWPFGPSEAITVVGDYAYLTNGDLGLRIIKLID